METERFLEFLNKTYSKLHTNYERLFWISYMGDHSVDKKFKKALKARDEFRSDSKLLNNTNSLIRRSIGVNRKRLGYWKLFFEKYQTPKEVLKIKEKIDALEAKINKAFSEQKEGYKDPYTQKFILASKMKMRTLMRTHDDEKVRKACWQALKNLSPVFVKEYIRLVELKNQYAKALGFEDFYAYKIATEEGMIKNELFKIFDQIYNKTKYAFKDVRKLEKKMPGLRKPWNLGYMMAGDFTKEEDQYYQFDQAIERWGRSFAALGIDFMGGELILDLLDRQGKYNNGFCHYPRIVWFDDGIRIAGAASFTCNVVPGQVGSGSIGMHTLFHEGGHAADRLSSQQPDSCINTEYPPASTAWAETQSMFIDTIYSSIEWRMRYAKNSSKQTYPWDLYERKVRKLSVLAPLDMMSINFVMNFEKEIYETKKLNRNKVLDIAKKNFRKYFDETEDSLWALSVPHIYSWESSCSYHGYGLAELALMQWREYFYNKYGYIVDNPNVGKEMKKVWALGSSKTFAEFVTAATNKKLSANPYLREVTKGINASLVQAKKKLKRMETVRKHWGKIDLNAKIKLVHGKKIVADNKKGFQKMAEQYRKFLQSQTIKA